MVYLLESSRELWVRVCARAKSQLNQFDRIELPDPHTAYGVLCQLK